VKPLLFALPGNEAFCARLAEALSAPVGTFEYRRFPDGESYVRLRSEVGGRKVALVCTLNSPDEKTLALIFAARTARELGATSVGLVAPYLAYMRQDKRFNPGEAVTSTHYSALLSGVFEWLVTVDPHLHRHRSLSELYRIETRVVHAAPALSAWIRENVQDPLVVGPDSESEQWAASIAAAAGAPHVALAKTRRGDREVEIALPDLGAWRGRSPVLVDDIISSGRTMAVAARMLVQRGFAAPYVVGIHGIFGGEAYAELERAGVRAIVTTDAVPHPSNRIGIAALLAEVVALLSGEEP
jgi:ribose-phosphate pyrophosphokinase